MAKFLERVGHRGAPRVFPANTMRSFQHAIALGCTMVECDVRQAADGSLVLAHDPQVSATDGTVYEITQHTSETLAALDLGAGEGVPRLTELVAWASQGNGRIMADMKCEGSGVEALVAEALAPLSPADKVVPGAGSFSRELFRACDPTLPLSFSLGGHRPNDLTEEQFQAYLDALTTDAVTWQYPLLTVDRIAALHARDLRVFAWTVDDLEIMQRLVADGVDGIISNRADLLVIL
ncbi:MAG: Glycerophosphoryl diester phosphodiesterase [Chthonomonadaceae bacterium]|nr:Glycerophosphoryl diester phosphodiesterase [Chthonomonadaceae bacterium]